MHDDMTMAVQDTTSNVGSITLNTTVNWPGSNFGPYTTSNIDITAPTYNFSQPNQGFSVNGDANFEGDVKIKGKSIVDTLSKIEDRLAILHPDPAKLKKYEALRKAYDHYKLLEKLINED